MLPDTQTRTAADNTPVEVDPGALSEICQAAEGWASLLRERARRAEMEFTGRPVPETDVGRYSHAADRIDQAIRQLRTESHESALARP